MIANPLARQIHLNKGHLETAPALRHISVTDSEITTIGWGAHTKIDGLINLKRQPFSRGIGHKTCIQVSQQMF
jgi:hypothetical protein